MSDKNDKIIKKMADIIKKQQALLNKFAQCMPGDPLCDPDDGKILETQKKPEPKPAPKPAPAPKKPDTNKADFGNGMLPQDLKSALDVAAPNLKGLLSLTVDGQNVSIKYNADKIHGASKIQQAVQSALANTDYSVVSCVGEMNPTWRPNFV